MDINYIGEHLLPGQLGRIFILSSFFFSIASCIAYFVSTNSKDELNSNSWKNFGRIAFSIHAAGIIGIFATLFYIIFNHYFEYQYAWQHSSTQLPLKYVLSCFWEGQEGSFLLWAFWHAVLGIALMFRAGKWEAPMLAVFAITQAFLMSMILGLYIGDYKIGTNPFLLLRQTMDAPIFSRANYLEFIKDGNGLNPLLQNYWMTIHPPTLFLGFAATIVPFAFGIAGLWKKDYSGWVAPALPWALFAVMVLGTGILMGGAWAYEALTFGGFWAWDPVENSSLVPWIVLVGGLHGLLSFKHTGHGLKLTLTLFILSFLLILYSTFLTRSGILGDTSVHSFTDLGMSGQLLFFMGFYIALSIFFLAINWSKLPRKNEEEATSSREFWLFVGALVLTISAFQITFTTSIPVFNKFLPLLRQIPGLSGYFEKDFAPPVDIIAHYNSIQVWVAIIVALLTGAIQYFRYKNSDVKKLMKPLGLSALFAVILTAFISFFLEIRPAHYILLLYASLFAIIANFNYLLFPLKGKLNIGGASIAHIGFALILLGALIANHNQEVISINNSGIDFGESFDAKSKMENILLKKNEPVKMAEYEVTYVGDTIEGPNNYYKVHYKRIDETGEVCEEFFLFPNAQINPRMGLIANPDTRHYWTKDIYTHVTSVPDKSKKEEDENKFEPQTVGIGDTFYTAKAYAVLSGLNPKPVKEGLDLNPDDVAVGIKLDLYTLDGKQYTAEPIYLIRNNAAIFIEDEISELNVKFRVEKILPQTEEVVIGINQKEAENDFIIMKAIVFPYINILWLGCVMMAFGVVISIIRRYQENVRTFKRAKT